MERARIEALCDAIIDEKRWRPFRDRDVTVNPGGFPITAHLTLRDRRIHLSFSEDFDAQLERLIAEHRLAASLETAIEDVVYHLLVHEYNHHHYCPNNEFLFEQILDGIRKVVEKREIRESRIRESCFEVHNMFADTVINAIECHDDESGRYRRGQDLANLLALRHNARGKLFRARSDEAMRLFLESNMRLCGTSEESYARVQQYLPRFRLAARREVNEIIETLIREKPLAGRVLAGNLLDGDPPAIVQELCEYGSWHWKAEEYARIVYPHMKQEHPWLKNGFTGKRDEQEAKDGPGEAKGEAEAPSRSRCKGAPTAGGAHGETGESPLPDMSVAPGGPVRPDAPMPPEGGETTPERTPVVAQGKREMGRGTGRHVPAEQNYELLDRLYRERSGLIRLESRDPGLQTLEVLRGTEEADFPEMTRVHLPSTLVVDRPDGTTYLLFRERRFPVQIDAAVRENLGGLPDLCFVFDSSGSMEFRPIQGSGEYHFAMLTFYSLLSGLERRGIAPLLNYNAVNFSDRTFASGWRPYRGLDEVKRVLFQHQGGGTTIEVGMLSAIRTERKDNYLLFLLSDLCITNLSDLEEELIKTHEGGCASVLVFKLGGESLITRALEKAGIAVFYPRNAEDFMNGSIRITRDAFSGAL